MQISPPQLKVPIEDTLNINHVSPFNLGRPNSTRMILPQLTTNAEEIKIQNLSRLIRVNKQKELDLDFEKFSIEGCFEAMIVNKLNLNRGGLSEIRQRDKPVYAPLCKVREEMDGFRSYFKLKKDLQKG